MHHFTVESTLRKSNVISKSLDGYKSSNSNNPFFIDRDGLLFYHVLNFLRTGTVSFSEDPHFLKVLSLEAAYFKLRQMETQITTMINQ